MTTYVTFGQSHAHRINNYTIDKDCVVAFPSESAEEGRKKAFDLFGPKFCFEYFNRQPDMSYFPRGLVWIEGEQHEEER